jgi:hypothetical protein
VQARPPYGMNVNGDLAPCKMDPIDPLVQKGVEPQVRMIINQPLPEHCEGKLIPGRTGNGPTTGHSSSEMPERHKVTPSPEKDLIPRGGVIESQVRWLLNQPPPDPLAQEWVGAEVRRILNEGGKRDARGADVGPPILGSNTGIPERHKPALPPRPLRPPVQEGRFSSKNDDHSASPSTLCQQENTRARPQRADNLAFHHGNARK